MSSEEDEDQSTKDLKSDGGTEQNSIRVTDENSGNIITISGGNSGDFRVEQGGDKEDTESTANTIKNVLTRLLRRLFESALGSYLDPVFTHLGWAVVGLLGMVVLSGGVAVLLNLANYQIGEQALTLLRFLIAPIASVFVGSAPWSSLILLFPAFAVGYLYMRFLTTCDEHGPFVCQEFTRKHYDRKEYNEKLEKYVTPEETRYWCPKCEDSPFSAN